MENRTKIVVIGCGNISDIYIQNILNTFKGLDLMGVYDAVDQLAEEKTRKYGLAKRYRAFEEILSDEEVEIVVNLTPPLVHYETSEKLLSAGKNVYSEKPLGVNFEQGKKLLELAQKVGKTISCSPDVPLGASVQTIRNAIERGEIGRVIGASANLIKRGVETWHPNPDFLYQPGAGPLLDMGPYYLSALIHWIGPVREVMGMNGISFKTRTITSQPRYGQTITVNVPTYVNSLLRFSSSALGSFTATFDVYKASLPTVEIYGSEGTITAPNPNEFSGPIMIWKQDTQKFIPFENQFQYTGNSRGLGLADMASALRTGRKPRASAELGLHVLEIMDAINKSNDCKTSVALTTTCDKPEIMKTDGSLD